MPRLNLLDKLRLWLLRIKSGIFDNNIYYINGSETLPPPLPAEEEDMMIRNIESD